MPPWQSVRLAGVNRRARVSLASALLLGVPLVVATAIVARPRYEGWMRHAARRVELARLLDQPADDDARAEALVSFGHEPEAVIALVERAAVVCSRTELPGKKPWRHAIELWAIEPEPRDPRPLERLDALANDRTLPDQARLELLYLREELREPTYRDVLSLPSEPVLSGTPAQVLLALHGLVKLECDGGFSTGDFYNDKRPLAEPLPRALVRIVQSLDARLVREGDRWRIKKRVYEEPAGADPLAFDPYDPASGRGDSCFKVKYREDGPQWCLVGRNIESLGPAKTLGLAMCDAEPVKIFRAIAALQGFTVPRRIAYQVYETAPVTSAVH